MIRYVEGETNKMEGETNKMETQHSVGYRTSFITQQDHNIK
jgi:hypothetical protein